MAEDPEAGRPDAERQLTKKGRKQARRLAKGLRRLLGRASLVSSPYVRAVQTAEILLEELRKEGESELSIADELRSGVTPEAAAAWLAQQDPEATLVVVGHEPDCSRLMAYLTSAGGSAYARFGKAGACLVQCPAAPAAGQGELIWLLTPDMLKRLGV
jgi:phosphohistidine phosphatase